MGHGSIPKEGVDSFEFRDKIKETRKKIEEEISRKIVETEFYKDYTEAILSYYYAIFDELLLIKGGYGIGKSRTLKQILNSHNIEHYIVEYADLNTRKKVDELFKKLRELDRDTLIVFDDVKLSKWADYPILKLLKEHRPIVVIVNNSNEISKLEKTFGRIITHSLRLYEDDLKLLINHISTIFNINLDKYVILCLRDLVNASISELTEIKQKTLIEKILKNAKVEKKNKELYRKTIKKLERILKKYNIELTDDIKVEIGVKIFGYSESTLRKNLSRYLY